MEQISHFNVNDVVAFALVRKDFRRMLAPLIKKNCPVLYQMVTNKRDYLLRVTIKPF
jgi:hypothetical protein